MNAGGSKNIPCAKRGQGCACGGGHCGYDSAQGSCKCISCQRKKSAPLPSVSIRAFDPTPLRPDAPAAPIHSHESPDWNNQIPYQPGLTARQHAAIALRVPDSGTDWLDAMIRARMRDDFAATCMPIEVSWNDVEFVPKNGASVMVNDALRAYAQADAMMEARDTVMGNVTR